MTSSVEKGSTSNAHVEVDRLLAVLHVMLVDSSGSPVSTAPLVQGRVYDEPIRATAATQGTRRVRPA